MSDAHTTATPPDIGAWIGRQQTVIDHISPVQVRQMAATLNDADRLQDPFGQPLPAGWHWCYFNPIELQLGLGDDGHPRKGGFLPPVALPRRMWAGSRLQWARTFTVGQEVTKSTRIVDVQRKHGRSGEMVFVTLEHHYSDAAGHILTEAHDIVYREAPNAAERAHLHTLGERIARAEHGFEREGTWVREVHADEVMLYRYSAATFNGHRIHYDQPYCREVEGYPGLVVHGPLIATLLLDWLERSLGATLGRQGVVKSFSFRAKSPTFHLSRFHLHAALNGTGAGVDVWSTNNLGDVGLDGTVELL